MFQDLRASKKKELSEMSKTCSSFMQSRVSLRLAYNRLARASDRQFSFQPAFVSTFKLRERETSALIKLVFCCCISFFEWERASTRCTLEAREQQIFVFLLLKLVDANSQPSIGVGAAVAVFKCACLRSLACASRFNEVVRAHATSSARD